MRPAFVAMAFAAAANAIPQGVASAMSPSSSAPAGCQPSYPGSFEITVVNATNNAKRDLVKRQDLTLTLSGGILKDQQSRTGYIASNYQFQFDSPPQAGAIYTAGFSLCANGSLALGGSAIFYQCYSGGFYNLYNTNWAPQCSPIYIEAIGASSGAAAGGSASPTATQAFDGQLAQVSAATTVPQRSDGQPYASTTAVTQCPDGQPNAPVRPVSQLSDGQPQGPASAPHAVSAKSGGQPAVSSKAPATTPASAPSMSGKSGGQSAATSAAPVSQISNSLPQASKSPAPAVTISPSGRPQATTQGGGKVTSTGSAAPASFSGAANPIRTTNEAIAAIAGFFGAIALL